MAEIQVQKEQESHYWIVFDFNTPIYNTHSSFKYCSHNEIAALCEFTKIEERIFGPRFLHSSCVLVRENVHLILMVTNTVAIIKSDVIYLYCDEIARTGSSLDCHVKLNGLVKCIRAGFIERSNFYPAVIEAILAFEVDGLLNQMISLDGTTRLSTSAMEEKIHNLHCAFREVMLLIGECKLLFVNHEKATIYLGTLLADCRYGVKKLSLHRLRVKQKSTTVEMKQVSTQSVITLVRVIGTYFSTTAAIIGAKVTGGFGIAIVGCIFFYIFLIWKGTFAV